MEETSLFPTARAILVRAGLPAAAAAFILLGGAAAAAGNMEPRKGTPECETGFKGGVPDCLTRADKTRQARPEEKRFYNLRCPDEAPFFWNWSATVTPGTFITMQEVLTRPSDGRATGARFVLHNQTKFGGSQGRVYLGCSTAFPKVPSRMTSHGNRAS